MENETKMFLINNEGKKIVKNIPKDLYSLYKNLGWKEEVEENKVKPKEVSSFSKSFNGFKKGKEKTEIE